MTKGERTELEAVVGEVSRETISGLDAYRAQLAKWAARINLIGSSTGADLWRRHILDSARVIPLAGQATRWIDLGSGAGLPGAVIAHVLRDKAQVHLVESNRKKTAFLALACAGTGAMVHAMRAEDPRLSVIRADIVTARAFAALPLLLKYGAPWLTAGARGLFHKGRDYESEVKESLNHWAFDLIVHRDTGFEGPILDIRNLRPA